MQNIKIPQNVQIADKLVGPFSLKQLLLVALGGGFSYALYASINRSVGYVPMAAQMFIWMPAILSAAFALVKINDLSLWRCCLLIVEMMSKPRRRSLLPRQGLMINIQMQRKKSVREEEAGDRAAQEGVAVVARVSTAKQVDTVFEEDRVPSLVQRTEEEEEAHRRRLDALWEDAKRRGVVDTVRSSPSR